MANGCVARESRKIGDETKAARSAMIAQKE
jgi:hypothetical protein